MQLKFQIHFSKPEFQKKKVDFQIVFTPPEAPTEGKNSKASNTDGQNFLMNWRSKLSFLVSCRQTTSHPLSTILSLIASHFSLAFKPLTFQQRTFHYLK
jgi:hypothetical protein